MVMDLYVVLVINLIIWVALFGYLWRMDTRMGELRRALEDSGEGAREDG